MKEKKVYLFLTIFLLALLASEFWVRVECIELIIFTMCLALTSIVLFIRN
jgi:hypothetical protein